MNESPATRGRSRCARQQLEKLGLQARWRSQIPDWPYDSLNAILFAEVGGGVRGAHADRQIDTLKMQSD